MKARVILALLAATLFGCGPSASQLKKTMIDNPDILAEAIKKNPKAFIDAVNEAAQTARAQQQQDAEQEESKRMEEEFKNPKTPEISDKRVVFGNKAAPITIVEYSDFQCPFCSRGYKTVKEVEKAYGDKVKVIYKHLPLEFHPMAAPAARFFEAIAMQDPSKAQKFHDEVFENQDQLKEKGEDFLKAAAKKVGANLGKLMKDVKSDAVAQTIKADTEEAQKFGFTGTPGFLINGVSLRGAYPLEEFKKVIDRQLQAAGSK